MKEINAKLFKFESITEFLILSANTAEKTIFHEDCSKEGKLGILKAG